MRISRLLVAGLVSALFLVPAFAAIPKATDVPPLVDRLKTSKDAKDRADAAKQIGHIGMVKKSLVKDAIPALVDASKDSDMNVKLEVYASLARMGAESEKMVPILIENLKSTDTKMIVGSAQALGYYGDKAEEALPVLKKLQEDNRVPRSNKEAEAKFTREELNKRRTIGRAVGGAITAIGGRKK